MTASAVRALALLETLNT